MGALVRLLLQNKNPVLQSGLGMTLGDLVNKSCAEYAFQKRKQEKSERRNPSTASIKKQKVDALLQTVVIGLELLTNESTNMRQSGDFRMRATQNLQRATREMEKAGVL